MEEVVLLLRPKSISGQNMESIVVIIDNVGMLETSVHSSSSVGVSEEPLVSRQVTVKGPSVKVEEGINTGHYKSTAHNVQISGVMHLSKLPIKQCHMAAADKPTASVPQLQYQI